MSGSEKMIPISQAASSLERDIWQKVVFTRTGAWMDISGSRLIKVIAISGGGDVPDWTT